MVSGKVKEVFQLSEHCHLKAKYREPFIKWFTKTEKARGRRPTRAELIAEMRRKGGPLRGMVKLSQRDAADEYWRTMARYYLRHVDVVRVNITTKEVLTQPVRAYTPLGKRQHEAFGEGGYVPTGRITTRAERLSVVAQARADFDAWLARFERYAEFMNTFRPVVQAYRKLQEELK